MDLRGARGSSTIIGDVLDGTTITLETRQVDTKRGVLTENWIVGEFNGQVSGRVLELNPRQSGDSLLTALLKGRPARSRDLIRNMVQTGIYDTAGNSGMVRVVLEISNGVVRAYEDVHMRTAGRYDLVILGSLAAVGAGNLANQAGVMARRFESEFDHDGYKRLMEPVYPRETPSVEKWMVRLAVGMSSALVDVR